MNKTAVALPVAVIALAVTISPAVASASTSEPKPQKTVKVSKWRSFQPCHTGKVLVKVKAPKRYQGKRVQQPQVRVVGRVFGSQFASRTVHGRTASITAKSCDLAGTSLTPQYTFRWTGKDLKWSNPLKFGYTLSK